MTYSCTSQSKTIIYADDTNILIAENHLSNAILKSNIAANEFYEWCMNNGLLVNTSKTFFMTFLSKNVRPNSSPLIKLNKKSIEQTKFIKFLGVTVDQKMTWEKPIEDLSSKLSSICFIIRQLRHTVSFDILRIAYFGLVQSKISYGLMFWGNATHINKIFIHQKKIIRCMTRNHPLTPCKQIFIDLGILTVPCLYIYLITLNIKKNEHILLKNNSLHNYDTRNSDNIHQPFSRLSVGQNSHMYQGIICFNKFKNLFGHFISFNCFRNALHKYLISNAFYSVDDYLCS